VQFHSTRRAALLPLEGSVCVMLKPLLPMAGGVGVCVHD